MASACRGGGTEAQVGAVDVSLKGPLTSAFWGAAHELWGAGHSVPSLSRHSAVIVPAARQTAIRLSKALTTEMTMALEISEDEPPLEEQVWAKAAAQRAQHGSRQFGCSDSTYAGNCRAVNVGHLGPQYGISNVTGPAHRWRWLWRTCSQWRSQRPGRWPGRWGSRPPRRWPARGGSKTSRQW